MGRTALAILGCNTLLLMIIQEIVNRKEHRKDYCGHYTKCEMKLVTRHRPAFTEALRLVVKTEQIVNETVTSREDQYIRLLHQITTDYEIVREVLPIVNKSVAVQVTFDIAYSQLVEMDSKNQILTSYIWVRQFWTNARLGWDPAKFGGIKSVHLNPRTVWVPDIVLYNNINENTIGEMFKFDTKVIIRNDGYIEWYAPTLIKSMCKIDITYFPFDRQTCKLIFGSWTLTSQHMLLQVKGTGPDLSKYTSNGEWDLMDMTRKLNIVKYSCCLWPYIDITYTLNIKRRPMFYVQNLIIPCILLATLSVLSFSLPPGSGERIALMITLLLGLTVYMLIFTENIPKTSEVVPLINRFFVVVLFEVAVCLLATSITLQFYHYHDPERDISGWLEFLIFSCLAKMLRMQIKYTSVTNQSMKTNGAGSSPLLSRIHGTPYRLPVPNGAVPNGPVVNGAIDEKLESINLKLDNIQQVASNSRNQDRWHFAAMVLDRFFCIISAAIIFISLLSFYVMIPP